ncbi:uncharacterized protein LOC104848022 [Fukomys damarensis]|uniref:uncharacterized protein LOC104848022 n=1 Tax=Fukomys damarensis TaxID=885580 RepID=UPI0005400E50|nr:uncharacterized protein LOC104848022 [Fukomys damarensis]
MAPSPLLSQNSGSQVLLGASRLWYLCSMPTAWCGPARPLPSPRGRQSLAQCSGPPRPVWAGCAKMLVPDPGLLDATPAPLLSTVRSGFYPWRLPVSSKGEDTCLAQLGAGTGAHRTLLAAGSSVSLNTRCYLYPTCVPTWLCLPCCQIFSLPPSRVLAGVPIWLGRPGGAPGDALRSSFSCCNAGTPVNYKLQELIWPADLRTAKSRSIRSTEQW